jgi:phosphomevalonate kinase
VTAVRLTVPGNILLLGEYAVLEQGGLGLAVAVEPRVRMEALPGTELRVQGRWPGGSGESPLITAAVQTVSEYLHLPCTGSLRVDSSSFFSTEGRKTGLGSSAAVAVALVCGLLWLAGRGSADPEAVSLSVRAHRRAQGGRGSGYDVLTSFHGGTGLVHGGTSPSWEPCTPPVGRGIVLFPGPAPVSTADAVERYASWKARNPGPARDFLRESNDAIRSFSRSRSLEEALPLFSICRRLGIDLGKEMGVPAELTPPPGFDPRWCKALGAGSELGCCLLPPGGDWLPRGDWPSSGRIGTLVSRAETGAVWE